MQLFIQPLTIFFKWAQQNNFNFQLPIIEKTISIPKLNNDLS